ncbi:MAG TPA: CDGSH iron-sulfur domain-containing protein [Jiangellaceae bacterium]
MLKTAAPYQDARAANAMTDLEPDNPSQAGIPSTRGPTREYTSAGITVIWDATRCIHTGRCLRELPDVFDLNQRPWVDVEAATAEEIATAIRHCPTDALRYRPGPGLAEEQPDSPTTIEPRFNGPLFVRGRVRIVNRRGEVVGEETRVALCRCGASANKPFCDNSHRRINFRS